MKGKGKVWNKKGGEGKGNVRKGVKGRKLKVVDGKGT